MSSTSRPKSSALFQRAQASIPGGVNSPVRAYRAVGGEPPFIARAKGAKVWDADGGEYIDYVGSWGPMILGHAHPEVIAAVREVAELGTSFGAPTEREVLFAEKIRELYPSIAMLRAVSSGTEATMSALRLARGFTGRDLVIKFEGCYHGHADFLLVKAGSGLATFGTPDSAGVPESIARGTVTLPYNDIGALEAAFAERGAQIAAVIVEPVVGNMGVVAPQAGFLEAILALCKQHGAVSIFDEVMTGCRVARGGMQERVGLRPDLTCLGKIVGGGMPLAAYGGRLDIMQHVAPLGAVYQAGTLSGNPVSVAAGLALLGELDASVYVELEQSAATLQQGIEAAITEHGVRAHVARVGSMLTLFFSAEPIRCWADAKQCDTAHFATLHRSLLDDGIYWPCSQYEAAFVSAAHDDTQLRATIDAMGRALAKVAASASS